MDLAADEGGLGVGKAAESVGIGGEVLCGEGDKLVVGDACGSEEDHLVGCAIGLDVSARSSRFIERMLSLGGAVGADRSRASAVALTKTLHSV